MSKDKDDILSKKLLINGIVLCSCGGCLISNSGKVKCDILNNKIYCWRCKKEYNFEKVYMQRKENQEIIYKGEINDNKII